VSERKITQISAMAYAGSGFTGPSRSIVALCDDGTLWDGVWHQGQWSWTPLPPVPQGPVTQTTEDVP
jgi:hypothetical protein